MRHLLWMLLASLSLLSFNAPSDERTTVGSNLKNVTIYRTGAEMIHNASANLKSGDNELVIEGLSSYLDINSLQVNCPAAVTILGVEFNNNYLGEENISPSVKKLKDSLENVIQDISRLNIQINTSTELLDVLRANKDIKGTQNGLSVAELAKLMNYYKEKSLEIQNELTSLRTKKTKLDQLSSKIQNQIAEEQKKHTRSGGRLNLQLSVAVGSNYDFTISYITQNAFWTPYYDIKADNIKSPMKFIYKAKISQTTGIDWKKVKLSLSTATPRQYGVAPLLRTWFLSYIDPVRVYDRQLSKENTIPTIQDVVVTVPYGTVSKKGFSGAESTVSNQQLYVVNGNIMSQSDYQKISPNSIKHVEVLKGEDATAIYGSRGANGVIQVTLKDGLEDYVSVSSSELEVTYDISLPYDVPTNGKQQVATLKEAEVPATYKYYAVPKLDKEAYLLAEVADWQTLNLLPGEANIIFENTYIGKSFIDPASTNDTLNLTLGVDKRVVIKREKLTDYSSVKFMGSNKLQTITYDITVKNNKKEAINLILKDQYPISTNKDIEVQLLESSNGKINEEIGVITWMLNLDPGQSKKYRISYSAKYPKGKQVNLN
jgi:TonB-dependent SusC/RagA subfamily outer membrane receptor